METQPTNLTVTSGDGRWWWDGQQWLPVQQQPRIVPMLPVIPKAKSTAVVLAVFFGFWAFIYTYRRDAAIFWINLVATIVTFGLWAIFVAYPWAIIQMTCRPQSFYDGFPYAT